MKPLICNDNILKKDLSNKLYLITGSNSGIGYYLAKQLIKQNANLVLTSKNVNDKRLNEIQLVNPDVKIYIIYLDLSSKKSIYKFAESFYKLFSKLDGLINNAGLMNTKHQITATGFEMQFGVNFIGHYLLTELLIKALGNVNSSRIICHSSCSHDICHGILGDINLSDINFDKRKYSGWEAYSQSKLANVLHAKALSNNHLENNIHSFSIHPGWVNTNLNRSSIYLKYRDIIFPSLLKRHGMISPKESIQTTMHALIDDSIIKYSGGYLSQIGFYRDKNLNNGGWPMMSPNPRAHDMQLMNDLINFTRDKLGLN